LKGDDEACKNDKELGQKRRFKAHHLQQKNSADEQWREHKDQT
jgi:hypothetical protein